MAVSFLAVIGGAPDGRGERAAAKIALIVLHGNLGEPPIASGIRGRDSSGTALDQLRDGVRSHFFVAGKNFEVQPTDRAVL